MSKGTILVTGASGFIAKYCIAELLRQGYDVRASVRRLERSDEVRASVQRALGGTGSEAEGISFVEADLLSDAGWDAAVAGCQAVLHVASPFPLREPKDRDELIGPARQGTLRVLAAAHKADAERVVVTSSMAAICYVAGGAPDRAMTEADWTDPDKPGLTAYLASKTIAERAAWDWADANGYRQSLAVINPGLVLGPALDRDLSSSLRVIQLYATGEAGAIPAVGYPISDVRDVARMHVAALSHPAAGGERWVCAEGSMSVSDMVRVIGEALPDLKGKMPRLKVPDFVIRGVSLFDRNARSLLPDLGRENRLDNSKAREKLGFEFRSAEEAVRSAALSLRELRVI